MAVRTRQVESETFGANESIEASLQRLANSDLAVAEQAEIILRSGILTGP